MKFSYVERNGVHLLRLDNEKGLVVFLSKIGASIYGIKYDDKWMTLTPKSLKDYFSDHSYYGKTIGPVSNRVKDGIIKINDKEYQLNQNEGTTSLHSGRNSLSFAVFDIINISENKDNITIVFKFIPHKNNRNLPGKVVYQISYTLTDKDELYVTLNAMSDEDTVVALTNHAYFCLGDEDISHLSMQISSKKYIESDKDTLIPLKEKDIISCLDFNQEKLLVKDINNPYLMEHKTKGYDHHFIFDKENKVLLENERYKLVVTTDMTGAQIYTDNYADDIEMFSSQKPLRRGVAIEPQDSTLNREVLKKGDIYSKFISYQFYKK